MMTTKRTFTVLGRIIISTILLISLFFSIELLVTITQDQPFNVIDKLTRKLGEILIVFFIIFSAFFMTNEWLKNNNKLHKPFPYFLYAIGIPIAITIPLSLLVFYLRSSELDLTKVFHDDTIIGTGIIVFFWALVHYIKYNFKTNNHEQKQIVKNTKAVYKKVFLYALGMAVIYTIFTTLYIYQGVPSSLKDVVLEFIFNLIIAISCWFLVSFFNSVLKQKNAFLSSLSVTLFGTFIVMKFIIPILVFLLMSFKYDYNAVTQYFHFDREFLNIGTNELIVVFSTLIYQILYFQQMYSSEKKEFKAEIGKQSEKYESLRRQLSPHFLFNNINVLTALIEENPQKAVRFSESLGNIYRHFLRQEDAEVVSLQNALSFSKDYLDLLKYRYEEAFQYVLPTTEASEAYIIPLALQQVIENTIKHNEVSKEKPLVIRITIENNYLIIQNTKQLKTQFEDSRKTGIENIKTRYTFLTEQKVIVEDTTNSFTIKLPLLNMENV